MQKTRQIAEDLIKKGLGTVDAAHIAFAQQAGALFISCDDKLLKKCLNRLKIRYLSGMAYLSHFVIRRD